MAEGIWRLIEAVITSKPNQEQIPVMFFGGGCSVSSVPLAALTGSFYNATQVCREMVIGGRGGERGNGGEGEEGEKREGEWGEGEEGERREGEWGGRGNGGEDEEGRREGWE